MTQRSSPEKAPETRALLATQVVAICGLRTTEGVEIEPWLADAQSLLTTGSVESSQRILATFILISYFIFKGQPARVVEQILRLQERILREETVRPLARITTEISAAWQAWINGDRARCGRAIEEGLAIDKESGVRHWTFLLLIQGITNALLHEDCKEARRYFKQLEPLMTVARDFDRAYYHNERGWLEILEGRPEEALLQQRLALELAEKSGAYYAIAETTFGLSLALHYVGESQQASFFLAKTENLARKYGSDTLLFQCGLVKAYYQKKGGDNRKGAVTLQETFEHGKQHGYSGFAWWLRSMITELCEFALSNDISPTFVCNLIKKFSLRPSHNRQAPSGWPWPIRLKRAKCERRKLFGSEGDEKLISARYAFLSDRTLEIM